MFPRRLLAVLAGILSATGAAHAQLVHWSPAAGGNGHWYRAVGTPNGIDWMSAVGLTSVPGQHLATLTSVGEHAFVFALIDSPQFWQAYTTGENVGPWIGAGIIPGGPNGPNWYWVTSEAFVYNAWAVGEPNGAGDLGAHFAAPAPARAATWGDRDAVALTAPGFVIEYEFLMDALVPGAAGGPNTLYARWGNPGANVVFLASTQAGAVVVPGCGGLVVNLQNPSVIGGAVAAPNGTAAKTIGLPGSLAGRGVFFQAVDRAACRVTNLHYQVL